MYLFKMNKLDLELDYVKLKEDNIVSPPQANTVFRLRTLGLEIGNNVISLCSYVNKEPASSL